MLKFLFGRLRETSQRFPLAVLAIVLLSALSLDSIFGTKIVQGVKGSDFLVLAALALWGTAAQLFAEGRRLRLWARWVLMLAGVPVCALYFYAPEITGFYPLFFMGALALFLPVAPYVGRASDDDSIWYFNYQNGVAVFFATIAALALCLGLSAVVASLDYLFGMKIAGAVYGAIWTLCFGLFWPLYVLSYIPRQFDYERSDCALPKGVSFISHYVLAPLMVVYMSVLYTYFVKLALQMELPKGGVAYMVSGFGILGTIVWILTYPAVREGRLLPLLHRHFHAILLLPVVILFLAIGVRIRDYGVTEDRYAIFLCGLWLALTAAVTAFSGVQRLKRLPLALSVLGIIASLGPWGAVSVSASSQIARLEKAFADLGMWHDGKLVRAAGPVSFDARKNVSSIMDYLAASGKVGRVEGWFAPYLDDKTKAVILKEEKEARDAGNFSSCRWCRQESVLAWLNAVGIEHVSEWAYADTPPATDSVCFYAASVNQSIQDIAGWDMMAYISLNIYDSSDFKTVRSAGKKGDVELSFEQKNMKFFVRFKSGKALEFDLQPVKDKYSGVCSPVSNEPPVVLRAETKELSGELRLERLQEGNRFVNMEGTLLLREGEP